MKQTQIPAFRKLVSQFTAPMLRSVVQKCSGTCASLFTLTSGRVMGPEVWAGQWGQGYRASGGGSQHTLWVDSPKPGQAGGRSNCFLGSDSSWRTSVQLLDCRRLKAVQTAADLPGGLSLGGGTGSPFCLLSTPFCSFFGFVSLFSLPSVSASYSRPLLSAVLFAFLLCLPVSSLQER